MFDHAFHIVLADVLWADSEARSVREGTVEVVRAHNLIMYVKMTTFWNVSVHILDNNGVGRANLEAGSLRALSKEQCNCVFVAELKPWFHLDAFTVPEGIQVWLAKPLVPAFNMILMLCC